MHLQKKHNGGTKTEREALAVTLEMTQRLLLLAEKTGGKAPELTITFPPGFLEVAYHIDVELPVEILRSRMTVVAMFLIV